MQPSTGINSEQASFLSDVQGIVLSGYGHLPRARYLFLQFTSTSGAQDWVTRVLPSISTAAPYPVVDGRKQKPASMLNVVFTPPGLSMLGITQETMDTFPPEFVAGVYSRSEILGDTGTSAPEFWEIGGPKNPEIHALLMLFGQDEPALEAALSRQESLITQSNGGVALIAIESAFRHSDQKEHFGFHDGVSQPAIKGLEHRSDTEQAPIERGEILLGHLNAYQTYPYSPTVPAAQDPFGILSPLPDGAFPHLRDLGRNSSYLVYRKLAQDVAGFWNFIERNAGADSSTMIHLASKMVGRWPSGTPVSLSPDFDAPQLSEENDFEFMPQDPLGYRCPFGAHIRRANPRDSKLNDTPAESLQTSSRHRLVRRGISYGEPLFQRDALDQGIAPVGLQDDGKPRGLHFFSINASIARQFEFVQQTWCDSPTFNAEFETKDPIIGPNDGKGYMTLQGCPVAQRIGNVPRFVTVRGGLYLFMPSLNALRYMATHLEAVRP
jgi:Dyp-type peroxidase family